MRRLLVQQVRDLNCFVMELILLVADVFDARARNLIDAAHVIFQLVRIRQANLAADHNAVCGGERFCSDTRLRLLGQKGIKYCIGNPVADFIRVTLGNGLRGKCVIRSCHETCSS